MSRLAADVGEYSICEEATWSECTQQYSSNGSWIFLGPLNPKQALTLLLSLRKTYVGLHYLKMSCAFIDTLTVYHHARLQGPKGQGYVHPSKAYGKFAKQTHIGQTSTLCPVTSESQTLSTLRRLPGDTRTDSRRCAESKAVEFLLPPRDK